MPKSRRKYFHHFNKVAFYIFTNGRQTLGLNLTERFSITDNALENMPWPDIDVYDATKMFKSKLRFQIRHGDFRQRISQDEEDINSILNWYKLTDAVFLDYLSQVVFSLLSGEGQFRVRSRSEVKASIGNTLTLTTRRRQS